MRRVRGLLRLLTSFARQAEDRPASPAAPLAALRDALALRGLPA